MAPERRTGRGTGLAGRADDLLLVVVLVIAALVVLQVVSAAIGTIVFLARVALVLALVGAVAAYLLRRD